MERSLTARLRPLGLPLLRGPARPSKGSRARARRAPHPGLGVRERGRSTFARIWGARRARLALLSVLIALPVLGGGFLIVRNSPLVSVEHVQVTGVHGAEASAIEAALVSTARHMSTLDVHTGALLNAVAAYRVVSAVKTVPSFPHGLRIEVEEQLPVAALLVNGLRTAVAANGTVLGPALATGALPTLNATIEPAAGARLQDATLLEAAAVLGAAPRVLARYVARMYNGPQGLTAAMSNGLLVYFGDALRPHAKWLSLVRVLADHSSSGASYIDVRVPARPAAGFPTGVTPPDAPASSEASAAETSGSGSTESTVSALAAGLTKETGVSSSNSATSSTPSSAKPSEAATESSQSSSGEASQGSSSTGTEASQEAAAPSG